MADDDEELIEELETEDTEMEEVDVEEAALEKIKKLKEKLKSVEREKSEYLAGWQRAKADFINARKDEEKARADFLNYAKEAILRDFLQVADSMELALKAKLPGVGEIYSQMKDIYKTYGVKQIACLGQKFNPVEHEAIAEEEVSEEDKDGVVAEEFQKGWMINDKVLRPAKVKIGVLRK
ncbi:nucleotide exchange factor GrpE [Candidatus Giovannonibacteria bacterium RIFCSPHIGHO2_02_42_15]|uniref:Protein GrpE n=2 Tax=Candidatus Giovannoniibacteriota TaxID=1752738 RepID=A0A1F5VPM4_9BACT|nr:MAG: Protein GrpE [Candidatus Giovannonibacteria bacterium GW2011_GWF2_42_19]OGF65300.1 MAG: nucleotide exchange factor GrpE [Candidatus Giovannonibacteria bacterium RIFCSPHIGHO2_02_42_15]